MLTALPEPERAYSHIKRQGLHYRPEPAVGLARGVRDIHRVHGCYGGESCGVADGPR